MTARVRCDVYMRGREIYRKEEREKKEERGERRMGLSPIGEALTLPLKLEREGQTCPAWIRWSHMQDPVGP